MADAVAPFTPTQVDSLNRFQRGGFMHPFTCPRRQTERGHDEILVAETDGWHCPRPGCDYTQDWAHWFMADKDWVTGQEIAHRSLWSGWDNDADNQSA